MYIATLEMFWMDFKLLPIQYKTFIFIGKLLVIYKINVQVCNCKHQLHKIHYTYA